MLGLKVLELFAPSALHFPKSNQYMSERETQKQKKSAVTMHLNFFLYFIPSFRNA